MNTSIAEAKGYWKEASNKYMRLIGGCSSMAPTPSHQSTIDAAKGAMEVARDRYFSRLFECILEKLEKG